MSNFTQIIKHPVTGEPVEAHFLDNHFGRHKYGIEIDNIIYKQGDFQIRPIKERDVQLQELESYIDELEEPKDLTGVKTYDAYNQGRFDERRDMKVKLIDLIEEL